MILFNNLSKLSSKSGQNSKILIKYFLTKKNIITVNISKCKKCKLFQTNNVTLSHFNRQFCTFRKKVDLTDDEKIQNTLTGSVEKSDREQCMSAASDSDNFDESNEDDADFNSDSQSVCEEDKIKLQNEVLKFRDELRPINLKKEEEIIKKMIEKNPKLEKNLKILKTEIDMLREEGKNLPTLLLEKYLKELLSLTSLKKRINYLEHLFKIEISNLRAKLKKKRNKIIRVDEYHKKIDSGELVYWLGHNSLLIRIKKQSINKILSERLMAALWFGQHIVFDCSYDEYMNKRNISDCVKQLVMSYSENRNHPIPFHLNFCNLCKDGDLYAGLKKNLCIENDEDFICDFHEESYLDLYPKEKLVYLSPHTNNELTTFSHDDIYIIGAFVDKGTSVKASLAKAKENGIRMAKLPLDRYLKWECGNKNLPVNTVTQIMLSIRHTNDWFQTFKENIPGRFLRPRGGPTIRLSHNEFLMLKNALEMKK